MVYIKKRAENDLLRLLIQLIEWKEHPHTFEQANAYIFEIVKVCHSLESLNVRTTASYLSHQKFGKYVYRFDKHSKVQWYIIYDFDKYKNIVIKKIISNNRTKN